MRRKPHVVSPATISLSSAKPKDLPKTLEEAVQRGVCTFAVTGVHFRNQVRALSFYKPLAIAYVGFVLYKIFIQDVFTCETCEQTQDDGCCSVCAERCHSGHKMRSMGVLEFFCDCGAEGENCVAMPKGQP